MTSAIEVTNVSKIYRRYSRSRQFATLKSALLSRSLVRDLAPAETFPALKGVTFSVPKGRTLGVIGRNGSGKSTLLKLVAGITKPTTGTVCVEGRVSALIELGAGFHPEISGRENVFINGIMLGLTKREITKRFDEIVEFAELQDFIDAPVKTYSSGMYMRLGFAVAIHVDPDVLLVDEVLAVGDAEFQARCLGRMEDFGATGRTVLFVSHNMQAMPQLCDRAILLDGGRVVRDGPSSEVVAQYLQTTAGAGSSREWPDLASAPGDDLVRLRSVRVVGPDGSTAAYVDVREPVGIEIAFRVLAWGPPILPKLKLSAGGHVAFNAMDVDSRWHEQSAPGDYVATAWMPGNYLNEGLVTVDPAVCSMDSPKLHHHVSVWQAVSFHVQDPGEGGSSRGTFTGQWKGVVRPLLEWTREVR